MSAQQTSPILYQVINAAFCIIVVISNIISAKMIKIPMMDVSIPAGLIFYPLTFLLSGLATEIYGAKKAKLMVYIAIGMNLLSLGIIQMALWLPAISQEEQCAFQGILGLSGLRIFSSLTAYAIAQIVDIQLYALIKSWAGLRFLWVRNNGSTCISQLVDTALVDLLYLHWGLGMSLPDVFPIMLISYGYKSFFSIANTPLLYLSVYLVKMNWKTVSGRLNLVQGVLFE